VWSSRPSPAAAAARAAWRGFSLQQLTPLARRR
jgi:hypothetical protein